MCPVITDPEVRLLAAISSTLEADYTERDRAWAGSPFAWIKTRPSRQVGAIGENLVAGWLAARGFNVARSPELDADRVIEGLRVEIKFSTLWTNTPIYKFQQLRDQNYDVAICLGISPFDAHCWVIEKKAILAAWRDPHNREIIGQHAGGGDTAWIDVSPANPGAWMRRCGGSLRDGLQRIATLTGFTPKDPNAEDGE